MIFSRSRTYVQRLTNLSLLSWLMTISAALSMTWPTRALSAIVDSMTDILFSSAAGFYSTGITGRIPRPDRTDRFPAALPAEVVVQKTAK
jgi:hypothetical protein